MAVKNAVKAVEMFFISSAIIESDEYTAINSGGLPSACFLLRIVNDSDQGVLVSYDGVTDHDFVPQDKTLQLPFQSNSQPNNNVALIPKGTVVYVKGTAGDGDIYVAAYYQKTAV